MGYKTYMENRQGIYSYKNISSLPSSPYYIIHYIMYMYIYIKYVIQHIKIGTKSLSHVVVA